MQKETPDQNLDTASAGSGCPVLETYIYGVEQVDKKAKADIDDKVKTLYLDLIPEGLNHSVRMAVGRAEAKILEIADELSADLIIIGRQGRGYMNSLFFGKTAEHIVRKASCPVLIVPEK